MPELVPILPRLWPVLAPSLARVSDVFAPGSPRAFGELGSNCPARGNAGFKAARSHLPPSTTNRGSPKTKLLAISAFVGVAYLFDPTFAGSFDSQMRALAYKFNSALDVGPYFGRR